MLANYRFQLFVALGGSTAVALVVLILARPAQAHASVRFQEAARCDVRFEPSLVDAKYLFSDDYGWFDASHFRAGDPKQLIRSVELAAGKAGRFIVVDQELHNGLTSYEAYYWVSGNFEPERATNVALGIYLDWTRRFETWQGKPPRVLLAPLTSFAIEDLPSHYVGFVAAARELSPLQVLFCYLGGVDAIDEEPPHFVLTNEHDIASLKRLENRLFTPVIKTEKGWRRVPWPEEMKLDVVGPGPHTWRFVGEQTLYLQIDG
ncbi:MAG: hypothetical protein J5I90_03095 [Caldilineales bacterium]|nr:hypothetical protein [Caldilineales bacterium]